jgi:hypothetical protein
MLITQEIYYYDNLVVRKKKNNLSVFHGHCVHTTLEAFVLDYFVVIVKRYFSFVGNMDSVCVYMILEISSLCSYDILIVITVPRF